MKVEKIENRILKYRVYDEKSGGVCFYTLDLDRFELTVSGEASGSYKWTNTEPHETFVSLMKRCSQGYICDKLFDEEWSNERAIEAALEDFDYYKDEFAKSEDIIKEIKEIHAYNYDSFMRDLEDVIVLNGETFEPTFDSMFQDFWDHHLTAHTYWNKKSIEWFKEYVTPILEEWKQ